MDPQGKTVLITGASSGIGAAAAQAFAAAGADVVLVARSAAPLHALAAALPGRPLVLPADVSDPAAAHALVARVAAERGRLDILVNNAGVGLAGPVAALDPAEMQRMLAVNVFGPLALIQAALPLLRRLGRGQIINVSSVVGLRALPSNGAYAASKAALDRLTEALRMELHGSGVAVTLVRPGTTRTAFQDNRLGQPGARRWQPGGVSPAQVADTLVRAARHEPRTVYVTLKDRARLLAASLAPGLAERLLARVLTERHP